MCEGNNYAVTRREVRLSVHLPILGFSIVAVIGSYLYSLWTASQREKAMLPRPAVDQIVKALRTYHNQVGRFPQSFVDLEARVWRHTRTPNFGEDERSLSMANYYYLYYAVDSGAALCGRYPSINDEKRARLCSSRSLPKQSAAGREHLSH